jgi:hypothetical protein
MEVEVEMGLDGVTTVVIVLDRRIRQVRHRTNDVGKEVEETDLKKGRHPKVGRNRRVR